MKFKINNKEDYSEIVESWVREFISTMDDGDDIYPGNDSGEAPFGVKIIFDGFGDLESEDEKGEYTYEEGANKDMMNFAVFIHKDSLNNEFPPHDLTPWCLIHRPKEEVCIWVWYDANEDSIDVIPFEDNNSTELDHNFIYDLIIKIAERDGYEIEFNGN